MPGDVTLVPGGSPARPGDGRRQQGHGLLDLAVGEVAVAQDQAGGGGVGPEPVGVQVGDPHAGGRGPGDHGGAVHRAVELDQPGDPGPEHWQGLGAKTIQEDAETSLRQLGVERLDLYYAHIDDRATPQEETVDALATLAERGTVGLLGASNHATWRIERARAIARAGGRPAYSCVQQEHSYLLPWPDPGQVNLVSEELVDYAAAEDLTLLAYSPLLKGVYARPGEAPMPGYDHPTNRARLAVLREVAAELGATPAQVVLAWLMRGEPPMIPVVGASTVAQLEELLGAVDLRLDGEVRKRLDAAGRHGGDW
jgi:aryl-alcohol dehydrogenase-like predicted oxidoreductase